MHCRVSDSYFKYGTDQECQMMAIRFDGSQITPNLSLIRLWSKCFLDHYINDDLAETTRVLVPLYVAVVLYFQ
jgi:hypothetical protein